MWLKTRHYGPFVALRRSYASLPEKLAPGGITLEHALGLLWRTVPTRPGCRGEMRE